MVSNILVKAGRFGEKTIDNISAEKHFSDLLKSLRSSGCIIFDANNLNGNRIDLELHFEHQSKVKCENSVCLQLEHEFIFERNSKSNLDSYKYLITWNRASERAGVFYYNLPIYKGEIPSRKTDRPVLSSMVATNRSVNKKCLDELYSERVKVIKYFERYEDDVFELWGKGWDLPPQMPGKLYSLIYKLLRKVKLKTPFYKIKNYRGPCLEKSVALARSKFNFCFENIEGLRGYVTEKIFDSMYSGCVPIYCGASDITDFIPSNCFVNYRDFCSLEELYEFMNNFTDENYREYLTAIDFYLKSDLYYAVVSESFVKTVSSHIEEILKIECSV